MNLSKVLMNTHLSQFLSTIRIVLVQTYHPGNIGAAARAMKTMGLNELYLVNPVEHPSEEAHNRAAGAVDVLENAQVVSSLDEAIEGCSLVFATSARKRNYDKPQANVRKAAEQIWQEQSKTAIVFGPERMGLSNDDINLCTHHLYIPSNPDYGILNMASAVQVVCYELLQSQPDLADEAIFAANSKNLRSQKQVEYPSRDNMLRFYEHLEESLKDSGFINKNHPGEAMQKLQRFFDRGRPTQTELNMLRGALASFEKHVDK